jgi:hypothetical protein
MDPLEWPWSGWEMARSAALSYIGTKRIGLADLFDAEQFLLVDFRLSVRRKILKLQQRANRR